MENSKTIKTINKFHSLRNKENIYNEDLEFLKTFELEFSKSIILDFGKSISQQIGHILLSATK